MKLPSSLCLVPLLFFSTLAVADGPYARVTLVDGRVVEGQLDEATDEDQLWVCWGDERVLLSMSYRWDEVDTIEIDGQPITPDELLARPEGIFAIRPEFFLFESDETAVAVLPDCELPPAQLPRAVSTNFEATLANWDGDVEPDGYEIAVTVVDEFGYPMPVRGTLMATLVGERSAGGSVPTEPVVLERWSERIDPVQFDGGPAVFRLPFRRIRPEVDLDIQPGGILQVEVGAFGQGRMASSAAVAIREFNAIRDRYELSTGERFFPGERHDRWSHD